MSKVFKVSGNFTVDGKWYQDDPAFEGKIVVSDNGNFCGYCRELYPSSQLEVNKTRYLVGALNPASTGRQGAIFYRLSNDPRQAAQLFMVSDFEQEGSWKECDFSGIFQNKGRARIIIEEMLDDGKTEGETKLEFSKLDTGVNTNGVLAYKASYLSF